MNISSQTRSCVGAVLVGACVGMWCVTGRALAAETKDAAKDSKAAPAASTNKAPAKVEIPKSTFVSLAEVKDRQKYKNYTDPFFPKTERIFPKPKPPTNAPPVVVAGTNTVDAANVSVQPPQPPPPPPPKWYAKLSLGGITGPLAIVRVGAEAYNFRQGQTREIITTKGPGKVTCVKLTKTTVELKMAGEDEVAVLELP